jgi:hypothetical protein
MESNTIKIFISGDFAPQLRVNEVIQANDYSKLYNDILPIIHDVDISITNLESPLINKGIPITKTGPNIKAPTNSINALKFAGFDIVTLANNHIMDYGAEGLFSTIDVCKKNNIDYVGVGNSFNEAKQIKYKDCRGKRIAFINVTENEWSTTHGNYPGANPLDTVSLFYQITEAKRDANYIILIIHGGHETYELPSPRMKKLYRYFIDLGVDAVIGHHTHCYSGHEVYKEKPIFYSLGNFVFDSLENRNNSIWNQGCAVTLCLTDEKIDFILNPFYQCNTQVGIHLYNENERNDFSDLNMQKTLIIQDDDLLVENFEIFLKQQKRMYSSFLEPLKNKYILAAMNRGLLPRFIQGKKKKLLLNIIRCEAHRDVVLSILSDNKG